MSSIGRFHFLLFRLKKYLPLGHNTQERGAEYLIIAKERLVLASADFIRQEHMTLMPHCSTVDTLHGHNY